MLFHFIIMKRISGVNGRWLSLSHIFRLLNPCSRDSSIFSLWSTWYIFHPLHNINVGASRGYRRCIQKALNSRRQKNLQRGRRLRTRNFKIHRKKSKMCDVEPGRWKKCNMCSKDMPWYASCVYDDCLFKRYFEGAEVSLYWIIPKTPNTGFLGVDFM